MPPVIGPKLPIMPLFMQSLAGETPINYSAEEFRRLVSNVWQSPGVLQANGLQVTQADTVGWAVKVSAGSATAGGYLATVAEPVTLNLAGSIQTNPIAAQYHAVFLCVYDRTNNFGEGYFARLEVAVDEGAGWSVPGGTAAAVLLGVINVGPGQTNIQDRHIVAKPDSASTGSPYVRLADYLANGMVSAHTEFSGVGIARARYDNGHVYLTGGIRRAGSIDFGTGETIVGTLPDMLRPYTQRWLTGVAGGTSSPAYRLAIGTDGVMTAFVSTLTATGAVTKPHTLFLDGMTYEID